MPSSTWLVTAASKTPSFKDALGFATLLIEAVRNHCVHFFFSLGFDPSSGAASPDSVMDRLATIVGPLTLPCD